MHYFMPHCKFQKNGDSFVITINSLQTQNSFLGRSTNFFFCTASKPTVGPTKPSIQWVMGMKLIAHLHPAKMFRMHGGIGLPHLLHVSILWCLIQLKDKFIFTCYLQSNHIEDWG